MRAVICQRHGPPEDLVVEDIDPPQPGSGEIQIRVKAIALNFFDILIIENKYQTKPDLPFSPGAEVAGMVEKIGDGVSDFVPGDKVLGYLGYGCCREIVTGNARRFAKMPAKLDFAEASGLTVTYGTSLHALRDRARLESGETLVVLGAAGGVGQAAVEIGKILGARVIAAASSDEKLAFCRAIGADETINYEHQDFRTRVKQLTAGSGANVVFDPVGGALAEPALRAMAWEGRYLVIGFASGEIPRLPLNLVLLKGCEIVGVYWGSYIERQESRLRAQLEQLMTWCADGALKPHVHATYPLDKTAEALNVIARRENKGKVVIVP